MEKLKSEWESTSVRNRYIVCIGLAVAVILGALSFAGVIDLSGGF
jgi:hypothetical protein